MREMQKLLTVGEVSVDRETYDKLEAAAKAQGKSVNLLADEAINSALNAATGSLASSLIALNEATRQAYEAALATKRSDVASELVLMAHATAALIAKALKGELK